MNHVSYKDLSPERYRLWWAFRRKRLRKALRNPTLSEKQKIDILKKIETLDNKSLITK
jgi:hypothetical protein